MWPLNSGFIYWSDIELLISLSTLNQYISHPKSQIFVFVSGCALKIWPFTNLFSLHFLDVQKSQKSQLGWEVRTFSDLFWSCCCSVAKSYLALWLRGLQYARFPCPSFKLMSFESVMPPNHLILSCPLLFLPLVFPSIKGFSSESALPIRCPRYWNFSISPSNEYSGLISFRIWSPCCPRDSQESSPATQFEDISSLALSLLYVPTLRSVHDYWKNHSLNIWTFVGKAMSLLFNMLSRFVIAFLPRSKRLLISWVQSPPTVISLGSPIFACLNPQEHVGGFQSPPFLVSPYLSFLASLLFAPTCITIS